MGGLSAPATEAMRPGWRTCSVSDHYEDHVVALRGVVKRPATALEWGPDNLGVGLYQARLRRQEFRPVLAQSPDLSVVEGGNHLLVACERGDDLAEVLASNLAFASGASFALFPEQSEDERDAWLEEIYALGEGGDVSARFGDLAQRARARLGPVNFAKYGTILFVTAGFPWGIAVPEVATTHMYRYPDFGRAIVEGLWASQRPDRGARTALLIDPQTAEGSEVPVINRALLKNGTLTYEYPDADGRQRRLVVDQAIGIGYDRFEDKFDVMHYHRFHSLDGVDWRDKAGKAALPVGTAITSWSTVGGPMDRVEFIVERHPLPRVVGSMAIQLHDGIWLFASHGFAPESAPLFLNNSCWSWHELSQHLGEQVSPFDIPKDHRLFEVPLMLDRWSVSGVESCAGKTLH